MPDYQTQLTQLQERLLLLSQKQDELLSEINQLRIEIISLKTQMAAGNRKENIFSDHPDAGETTEITAEEPTRPDPLSAIRQIKIDSGNQMPRPVKKQSSIKSDIEKFIGENLISKIGIVITVIGVAIGAKYAIDHQLISPLTRIILGYAVGIGLLGFAIRLRRRYENFSAVLLSGAMAIMYFITYAAYGYYQLVPQAVAFSLMLALTAFTVLAAISYNRQVIAVIGMVGAYAVPFLLSDGSGRVLVLFAYMAIINLGILAVAVGKYWKPLYHLSFALTWLIYLIWYILEYDSRNHFLAALLFLFIFFIIFYLTFLCYKLIQKEKFSTGDIIAVLVNSFIFYGVGYALLGQSEYWGQLQGLFTVCNAIIHALIGFVIYRQKLADRNLFYLVSGLALIFLTIAIPVQLNGSWITLLWAGEAALLFWIGRTRKVYFYEKLSYLLMILAFISLIHDWTIEYYSHHWPPQTTKITPFFNVYFLTAVLFIASFGFINVINRDGRYIQANQNKNGLTGIFSLLIPAIVLFAIYYCFRIEIETYWNGIYMDSALTVQNKSGNLSQYHSNSDLTLFRTIWVIDYSLFFVSALAFVNLKKLRSERLGLLSLGLIVIALAVFLTQGLFCLSRLRESYLDKTSVLSDHQSWMNLGIRYISFVFVTVTIFSFYKQMNGNFLKKNFRVVFDGLLYISIVWIASSELINWMDIARSAQSYKLGLSILWGSYSLLLIILGISQRKKYLRIGAIVLFAITLLKLFFYDMAYLDTISKTIVFVSLGILLLIISFLYNKYKSVISGEGNG